MSVIVERRGRRVSTRSLRSNLELMVTRPGGIRRDEAIAEANRRVEAMRGPSMEVVHTLIETLDGVFGDAALATSRRLAEMRRIAGQIITLSETFGLAHLAEATKRLCDLTSALLDREKDNREVLKIHVRAVRMFSPKQNSLAEDASRAVLDELTLLLRHLGVDVGDHPSRSEDTT